MECFNLLKQTDEEKRGRKSYWRKLCIAMPKLLQLDFIFRLFLQLTRLNLKEDQEKNRSILVHYGVRSTSDTLYAEH